MSFLRNWGFAAAAVAGLSLGGVTADHHEDAIWKAVHDNSAREAGESTRDTARHPEEFLRFLGIKPDMAVAEVNPGGGWYSRILGPLLKADGKYVGLEHNPEVYAEYANYAANLRAYPEKFEAERDTFGPNAVATWIPATEGLPVEADSLDAIIIVRALHNWWRRDFFDKGMDQAHAMLKPGGVMGIVQHRMNEDFDGDRNAAAGKGRWKQSDLVAAIEAHGFKLVEASEMNANPKDEQNYEKGVWTLPPRLANGDTDKAKYEAIGESDRMTLKFMKVE
ncbi:class I SAM-dependent methyltransferase [Kordiimonas sp.]|uniref:class I SAM-dependent methyltransferase n=1 Tax=Kordiimonas sp. TaxID=1970157 RepID=UPI003A929FE6